MSGSRPIAGKFPGSRNGIFVVVDFAEILVFFKEFQKAQAVFFGPPVFHELEKNDRPGYDGKSQQQQQDQFDDSGRIFNQIDEVAIMIDGIDQE
jgi:hypothetical protein